jgi:hypothetical protein
MIEFRGKQSAFLFPPSKSQISGSLHLQKAFVSFAATVRQLTSQQIRGFVSFVSSPKVFL